MVRRAASQRVDETRWTSEEDGARRVDDTPGRCTTALGAHGDGARRVDDGTRCEETPVPHHP